MQILEVVVYSHDMRQRSVKFSTGALNIVTGDARTGKSALHSIVEYCLGQSEFRVPGTVISEKVAWFGVLFELPYTRIFVARPAPPPGNKSSSIAMLEVGADVDVPHAADLRSNASLDSLRTELNRFIGIDVDEPESDGLLQQAAMPSIGLAKTMCFQTDTDLADPNQLFHLRADQYVTGNLKQAMPFFLGSVPPDFASKRNELAQAQREARRLQVSIKTAMDSAARVDSDLAALVTEAYAHGLLPRNYAAKTEERGEIIALLRRAVDHPSGVEAQHAPNDSRRRELERTRRRLRQRLREIADSKALLEEHREYESDYSGAIAQQAERLETAALLPESTTSAHVCPVCSSQLEQADPTAAEIEAALAQLNAQLGGIERNIPRGNQLRAQLDEEADDLRRQIVGIDAGLKEIAVSDRTAADLATTQEQQAFLRGRIDAHLSRFSPVSDSLGRLNARLAALQARIDILESDLDIEKERARTASLVNRASATMRVWAAQLGLDHANESRLDLQLLTVVADTGSQPITLARLGSTANRVGYHIVAHLALHQLFVEDNRPVPRFLMLDQPSQAYYESEHGKKTELNDNDRAEVIRTFQLLRTVVSDLAPGFQIIVCEHANLDEDWFQTAVGENSWYSGTKLVPDDWPSNTQPAQQD
ncbi:DUF3732 domain-containing protein [Mycobacteroides abscessus]|uniref:DUF3732 domain-containing protein n=1 Tax=Mycobacteroides abscessus TaxID=36809 RepID=UPI0009A8F189|nr:DUF3732 domain-containing protein [Mycobacteroides abscessus]